MPGTATSNGANKSWAFYGVGAVAAASFGYLIFRKHKKTLKQQTSLPATTHKPVSSSLQSHSSTAHLQRTLHTEAKRSIESTPSQTIPSSTSTVDKTIDEKKVHEGEVLERKKAIPDISLERKVTVYVWPRGANSSNPKTWLQTGHAALRTYVGGEKSDGYYVSFWPANTCNKSYDEKLSRPNTQKICSESKAHFHSFTQDDRLYGTGIYQSFDLSLDVDAINEECKKIALLNESNEAKSEDLDWSIFGSSVFRSKNTRNCSGLSYHLLQKSGAKMLEYPATDFFGHLFFLTTLSISWKAPEYKNLSKKMRFIHGIENAGKANIISRLFGLETDCCIVKEKRTDNYMLLIALWFLAKGICFTQYPKHNSLGISHTTTLSFSIVAAIIIIYSLGFTKTIVPTDVAIVASYNQHLREKKFKTIKIKSFLYNKIWPYEEHGFLSRQTINYSLSLAQGIATGYLTYLHLTKRYASYRLIKSVGIGAGSALSAGIVMLEPRVLHAALFSLIPHFFCIGFKKEGFTGPFTVDKALYMVPKVYVSGISASIDMCDINKSKRTFGFVVWATLAFLASDLLIEYIEHRNRKRGNPNILRAKEGFLNKITASLKTPRFWIKTATFTGVVCAGFFSARKLLAPSYAASLENSTKHML